MWKPTPAELKMLFSEQETEEEKQKQIDYKQERLKLQQERLKLAQRREKRQEEQEQQKRQQKQATKQKTNDNIFYFTCIMQFLTILITFMLFIFIMR